MVQEPDPLSRAAALLRSGYKDDGRTLLVDFLKNNPNSAKGWWLMSYAVDDPDQKISCLNRVLLLAPNHHKAKARLAELTRETGNIALNQPVGKTASKKQNTSLSLPAILVLIVFGCFGFLAVGYLGYQIFFLSPVVQPTQAIVAQNPNANLMGTKSSLPSTWTPTPTFPPTVTSTDLPKATATPLVSITPTPDPNATQTPIPENKIGTSVGQFPPDFTLVNSLTGEEVSLRDYVGQPVLILFLTTWCPSCEREMPGVQEMYEKYHEQGFVVIGVGLGASRAALRNYAGRFGTNFPLLSDWERDVAEVYGVNYIPTNYFIRKSGKIWQSSVGMMDADELDTAISSILKVP